MWLLEYTLASRDTRVRAGASAKASKEEARFDEVYKPKRRITIACSQNKYCVRSLARHFLRAPC